MHDMSVSGWCRFLLAWETLCPYLFLSLHVNLIKKNQGNVNVEPNEETDSRAGFVLLR